MSIASGTSAVPATPVPSSARSGAALRRAAARERVDVCLIHELSSMDDGKGSALSGSSTRTASLRPTRPAAVLNRGWLPTRRFTFESTGMPVDSMLPAVRPAMSRIERRKSGRRAETSTRVWRSAPSVMMRCPGGSRRGDVRRRSRAAHDEELLEHRQRQADRDEARRAREARVDVRDEHRRFARGGLNDFRNRLEAREAELELDVILPDLLHERHDALGDDAHGEPFDRRHGAVENRRVGAAAEQAVDEEVRELAADVDDALLADRRVARAILDVEDERVAARRQRQHVFAERDLLDALQLEVDDAADAAHQPAFERFHEAAVHRLERAKTLASRRGAGGGNRRPGRRAAARCAAGRSGSVPCIIRSMSPCDSCSDVRGVRGAVIGSTNCGKNTLSTAPFGKSGATASSTSFLIASRCARIGELVDRLLAEQREHAVADLGFVILHELLGRRRP